MTWKVQRQYAVAYAQQRKDIAPRMRGGAGAMQQQHRRRLRIRVRRVLQMPA